MWVSHLRLLLLDLGSGLLHCQTLLRQLLLVLLMGCTGGGGRYRVLLIGGARAQKIILQSQERVTTLQRHPISEHPRLSMMRKQGI